MKNGLKYCLNIIFLILVSGIISTSFSATWFIATIAGGGDPANSGRSPHKPKSIQYFAERKVQPGDSVFIMGGFYGNADIRNPLISYWRGNSQNWIHVFAYKSQRAVFGKSLCLRSSYIRFTGLHFVNDITPYCTIVDSSKFYREHYDPSLCVKGCAGGNGLNFERKPYGQAFKLEFFFCYFYRSLCGLQGVGSGIRFVGCLFYANGYQNKDRPHGHGAYLANTRDQEAGGGKWWNEYEYCMSFYNYGNGYVLYTSGNIEGHPFNGNKMSLSWNMHFQNGQLAKAPHFQNVLTGSEDSPTHDFKCRNSVFYYSSNGAIVSQASHLSLAYRKWPQPHHNFEIEGNLFIGGGYHLRFDNPSEDLEFKGNHFYSRQAYFLRFLPASSNPVKASKNKYWYTESSPETPFWFGDIPPEIAAYCIGIPSWTINPFSNPSINRKSYSNAQWREAGFDLIPPSDTSNTLEFKRGPVYSCFPPIKNPANGLSYIYMSLWVPEKSPWNKHYDPASGNTYRLPLPYSAARVDSFSFPANNDP